MLVKSARVLFVSVLMIALPSAAGATSITGNLTADDNFSVYISLNDTTLGSQICNDPDAYWGTVATCGPAVLTAGVTNYLHVVASDEHGPPSMFIGTFSLSDGLFQFSNGSQSLNTNATDWAVRATSFADANVTPIVIGPNGTGPWGFFPTISASASYIWDAAGGCDHCTRFFSTAITPTTTTPPAVPEPATLTLLGLGLAGCARQLRKS